MDLLDEYRRLLGILEKATEVVAKMRKRVEAMEKVVEAAKDFCDASGLDNYLVRKLRAALRALEEGDELTEKIATLENDVPEHEHESDDVTDLDELVDKKIDDALDNLTIQRG